MKMGRLPRPILATLIAIAIAGPALWAMEVLAAGLHGQFADPPPAGTLTIRITALAKDRAVTDLRQDELRLFINRQEAPISSLRPLSSQPLKLAILDDISASRRRELPGVELPFADKFLSQLLGPSDQGSVVAFNDSCSVVAPFTTRKSTLGFALMRLAAIAPHGVTALYDALYASCDEMTLNGGDRPAFVIVSDGRDNSSNHDRRSVLSCFESKSVVPYFILTLGSASHVEMQGADRDANRVLEFARPTGGMVYLATDRSTMGAAFQTIAEALRSQYAIEFKSTELRPGTKGPKIRVDCSRRDVQIVTAQEPL